MTMTLSHLGFIISLLLTLFSQNLQRVAERFSGLSLLPALVLPLNFP